MRVVLVVALCARAASAEPMLGEWNDSTRLQPASQLELGACTLNVTLRGAIADFDLHQTIGNPGPGELAAAYELDLPAAGLEADERGRL